MGGLLYVTVPRLVHLNGKRKNRSKRFPHDEAIPYNLACYKCQSGELGAAREWLERALKVGDSKRVKKMAATDPDLMPLWEQGVKIN